jgi:hypothetical protein
MAWNLLKKLGIADHPTLVEYVDAERKRYVDGFVVARNALSQQTTAPVAEVLISINTDKIKYPYRYLRVDLLTKDQSGNPRPIKLEDGPKKGKSRIYSHGKYVVEAHPFVWCDVTLRFNAPPTDIVRLEEWMTEKLDVTDTNSKGPKSERLAAHSFTPIEQDGAWWRLGADLGTASSATLIELIEILGAQGATQFVLT